MDQPLPPALSDQAPVARLTDIRLAYAGTTALADVSLALPAGGMVGL